MKKWNKWLLLPFLALMVACSRGSEPKEENTFGSNDAEGSEVVLELESSIDEIVDELKAAQFELGASGAKLKLDDSNISSVVLITDQSRTKQHYVKIEWKRGEEENQLKFVGKVTDLETDLPLKLTNGIWYMTGYLGGEWDQANKRVTYDVNGTSLAAMEQGGVQTLNVPIYFPWSKLKVSSSGSESYGQAKTGVTEAPSINFRTLGVLMRVTLKNEMEYSAKYSGIRYDSNVLATRQGYYSLALNDNPMSDASFVPTYVPSVSDEPEYSLSDTPTLAKGAEHTKSYLVWGAPQATSESPLTHILANAKRIHNGAEKGVPAMNTIYVWGSTGRPKERSRVVQKTRLVREKLALEYFDNSYVLSGDSRTMGAATYRYGWYHTNQDLSLYPQSVVYYPTDVYDRDDFISPWEVNRWKVPTYHELMSLIVPTGSTYGAIGGGRSVGFAASYGLITSDEYTATINGVDGQYIDVYNNGSTIYAIRLDDKGERKQYTAWRYQLQPNGVSIECVVLGPTFKGNIGHVSVESFWIKHNADIISRYYTKAYTLISRTTQGELAMAVFGSKRHTDTWFYALELGVFDEGLYTVYRIFHHDKFNQQLQVDSANPLVLIHKPGMGWDDI